MSRDEISARPAVALSPADVGRMHALQAIADAAKALAQGRTDALAAVTSPHDREYLQGYASTCQGVADRIRNSPGYAP